jgi:hypothetical protein
MEDDIKYQFEKIITMIEDMKRLNLAEIKQKIQDIEARDIKEALREIKNRLDDIESKIQK